MHIKTGANTYPCRGYHPGADTVAFGLKEAAPEELGATVELCTDDGFVMAVHAVADWLRWEVQGTTLVLTNLPVPEPIPELEQPVPQLTTEEAIMEMVTDLDYRTSLLELGIGGTL